MALAISGLPPKARMEHLLRSLEGILAARIVIDSDGSPVEIHVMCPPDFHPKQVVRNVESALSAGFGLHIDRRIVSVAQVSDEAVLNGGTLDPDGAPTTVSDGAHHHPDAGNGAGDAVPRDERRLVLSGFEAERDTRARVVCRVRLREDDIEHLGTGEGPDTPIGRARAGARATFAALLRARQHADLALEDVAIVQLHGRDYVHLSAHLGEHRSPVELTGTALIERSPDEAAVFAALQATNRWTELPD
ncbi:MAG: hypothetical protein ACODAE_04680 [Gemmatimonadota bacterium]